jgi:phytoene dehydrogenase-like protein
VTCIARCLRQLGGQIQTGHPVISLDDLHRHGPGVFKVDYALSAPVPWTAEACPVAGTVHLGPSFAEIDAALRAACGGDVPAIPFLIVAQSSLFDSSSSCDSASSPRAVVEGHGAQGQSFPPAAARVLVQRQCRA